MTRLRTFLIFPLLTFNYKLYLKVIFPLCILLHTVKGSHASLSMLCCTDFSSVLYLRFGSSILPEKVHGPENISAESFVISLEMRTSLSVPNTFFFPVAMPSEWFDYC